jgi:hypothetical protein
MVVNTAPSRATCHTTGASGKLPFIEEREVPT